MSFIKDIFSGVEKILSGVVLGGVKEALNTKSPDKLIQPGDIELIDIMLMSEDETRTYSLMAQVTGVDIFESILSPVIYCELTIADSIGLLQNFPIIGEEYVRITYRTPKNTNTPATFLFRVNRVNNKSINTNNKMMTYTLQLVSAELLRNATRLITKKANDSIDNIIKQIITDDLQTEKPVAIDPTSGIESVLLTKMEPLKAIDFLRQRAVSTEYESSSFCFFESRKGYRFTTIERMIDEGAKVLKTGNTDKVFFFDSSRKDSIQNVTVRNIIAYNQIIFTDTVSQLSSGGLNNVCQSFDMITGNLQKVTYTDNIGGDKFKSTSDTSSSMNTTGFVRNHGKTTTVVRIVPTRSDKPQLQLAEKITKLQGYAQKISQSIVQIHIYGDSDIHIGDMIQCSFPSATSFDNDKGVSRLDSGNYLVSKIRHLILNGDRPQYTMALELIKGDLQEVV